MSPSPNEAETLRLVTAFLNIRDPDARRIILAIAEATASGAPIMADALAMLTSRAKQG